MPVVSPINLYTLTSIWRSKSTNSCIEMYSTRPGASAKSQRTRRAPRSKGIYFFYFFFFLLLNFPRRLVSFNTRTPFSLLFPLFCAFTVQLLKLFCAFSSLSSILIALLLQTPYYLATTWGTLLRRYIIFFSFPLINSISQDVPFEFHFPLDQLGSIHI